MYNIIIQSDDALLRMRAYSPLSPLARPSLGFDLMLRESRSIDSLKLAAVVSTAHHHLIARPRSHPIVTVMVMVRRATMLALALTSHVVLN